MEVLLLNNVFFFFLCNAPDGQVLFDQAGLGRGKVGSPRAVHPGQYELLDADKTQNATHKVSESRECVLLDNNNDLYILTFP
jgi:hypothetical protein